MINLNVCKILIFSIICINTAVANLADSIVFTPIPSYSTVHLPFKQANIQTCVVNGTVTIFLNSPGDTIMGLENNRGAIKEVFRDQTLNQADVVFGCNKYSTGSYKYVYLSDQSLYMATDGVKESMAGTFTNLIRSTSKNDVWAIARGALNTYYWIAIRDEIEKVAQMDIPAGEYFAVHSSLNHASIVSLTTHNHTSKTAEYYICDTDTTDILSSSVDIFFPLNPAPNLKVIEHQQENWICGTELASAVTRLTTITTNTSGRVYDSYEDAQFLDVAILGTNYDTGVVALATGIYGPYTILVHIWNFGGQMDLITTFTIGINNSLSVPDPSVIRDFFSLVRLDDNTAQLIYVLDGVLYGRLISLNGSISGWNDLVVSDSTVTTVESSIILSSLILEQNSKLIVQEGAILQVSGCAVFNGTLLLVLSNETIQILRNSSVTIDVIQYTCLDGTFSEIGVDGDPDLKDCEKLIGNPSYSPSLLAITVSIDNSQCNLQGQSPMSVESNADNTALIAGVVAGGGCVLVVGILLLAFYFSPIRQKVFPYAKKPPQ
jgi:hypothetical protein